MWQGFGYTAHVRCRAAAWVLGSGHMGTGIGITRTRRYDLASEVGAVRTCRARFTQRCQRP